MALSIEEKYDEVRQLISIGKEKGYLLYDEVNELLPSEITSSDELDDHFEKITTALERLSERFERLEAAHLDSADRDPGRRDPSST